MNNDGAVQFAPFASLRGYYDQIERTEELSEPRRELSEDAQAVLSRILSDFKKGNRVYIRYYNGRRYVGVEGVLSLVCFEAGAVVVADTVIGVEDIIWAKILT